MGAIWAHEVPALFQADGLQVEYYAGWELRSRGSGGYEKMMAIGIHHDASPSGTPIANRLAYAWKWAAAEPIGAMWIHTDGKIHFGAAGATNTQGTQLDSDPLIQTSKGLIPHKRGNYYMFSIEMSNNGVGEVWTKAQLDTLERVLVILCRHYDLDPLSDIVSHWRYTARKIDPRGPTPARPEWGGSSGLKEWDDDAVGRSVEAASTSSEEDMATKVINKRLYDSRPVTAYSGKKSTPKLTFDISAGVPAGTKVATVRFTTTQSDAPGWAVIWGKGNRPVTSSHNQVPGQTVGSTTNVELEDDGTFHVYVQSPTHLILDTNSYEAPASRALQG